MLCCWNHLLLLSSFDIPPLKIHSCHPVELLWNVEKSRKTWSVEPVLELRFAAVRLLPLPYFCCCLHNLNSDHLSLGLFQTSSRWLFAALWLQSLSWLPTCDKDLILSVCPSLDSYLSPIASLIKNCIPSQQLKIFLQNALSFFLHSAFLFIPVRCPEPSSPQTFPSWTSIGRLVFFISITHLLSPLSRNSSHLLRYTQPLLPQTYSHGFLWMSGT